MRQPGRFSQQASAAPIAPEIANRTPSCETGSPLPAGRTPQQVGKACVAPARCGVVADSRTAGTASPSSSISGGCSAGNRATISKGPGPLASSLSAPCCTCPASTTTATPVRRRTVRSPDRDFLVDFAPMTRSSCLRSARRPTPDAAVATIRARRWVSRAPTEQMGDVRRRSSAARIARQSRNGRVGITMPGPPPNVRSSTRR